MMPSQQLVADLPSADASFKDAPFYHLRDHLVRIHRPADELEIMLVTQVARMWLRHQDACALEAEAFAVQGLSKLFNEEHDRFKSLTRYVAETERMWRHALDRLRRTQR